jgi:carbamoyl-phosphate synthase large subunit
VAHYLPSANSHNLVKGRIVIKVLVTGVGGGVGQSIIKSFQDSQYHVIGVDGEYLGTGLYAVNKAYTIPYAVDPLFADKILDICTSEGCSLIFPGMDAELPVLSQSMNVFKQKGIIPVVSSEEVVSISDDKLATYQFLTDHGFFAPLTVDLSQQQINDLKFPLVLKPRRGGARSRGVHVVRNSKEFDTMLTMLDLGNYVAQEYIEGDEYTCGSVNFNGHCYGPIVMRRILRDGDTYKAFVISNPSLENYVRTVAEELQPFGACNFQLRLKNDKPFIFEINARCSGTTYARSLAGFNEPVMVADYLLHGKTPDYKIRSITILRYWKELVVENQRIERLKQLGKIDGAGSEL